VFNRSNPNRSRSTVNPDPKKNAAEDPNKVCWQVRFQEARELIRYLQLTRSEQRFLDGLLRHADKNHGRCYPSLQAIADEGGMGLRSAKTAKDSLLAREGKFLLKPELGGTPIKLSIFDVLGRAPDGRRSLLYQVFWQPILNLLAKLRARKKAWRFRSLEERAALAAGKRPQTSGGVQKRPVEKDDADDGVALVNAEWAKRFRKAGPGQQLVEPAIARERFSSLVADGMAPEAAALAAFDADHDDDEVKPETSGDVQRRPETVQRRPETSADPTPRPVRKTQPATKQAPATATPGPDPALESYVRELIADGWSPQAVARHIKRKFEHETQQEHSITLGGLIGFQGNGALAIGGIPLVR